MDQLFRDPRAETRNSRSLPCLIRKERKSRIRVISALAYNQKQPIPSALLLRHYSSPQTKLYISSGGNVTRIGAWAPHGRLLTACLVALNVFLVLLVYVYFWRFFSRAPRRDEEDGAASSSSSEEGSPKARDRRDVERAVTALPVFVHSSSDTSATAECAICIAEFADGEEGRMLPRCGHRFHARCVGTWFRVHTTCPLCRDTVIHVVAGDSTE